MNILWCLLLIAALASLFVTGPNLSPVQSYAAAADNDNGDYKITKDYKDSIKKDVYAESDKTNQHLGQDNLCYRGDDCEQANEGEQVEGKDNAASGFNDQSKSIGQQQQQPSAVSTAPIPGTPGNGTSPTPTPTPPTAVTLAPTSALSGVTSTPTPTPPTAVTLAPTSALSGVTSTPTPTPTLSQPDDECLFEPSLPKCAPGEDGKCPSGFNMNGDGNCFPDKPCPSGYENHDYDETGKCWRNRISTNTNTNNKHLNRKKHMECNLT